MALPSPERCSRYFGKELLELEELSLMMRRSRDAGRSGTQQAMKPWPTRASLRTATPPAPAGAAHAPPERQWAVAMGGTHARAGPVVSGTSTRCRRVEQDTVEPRSVRMRMHRCGP